MNAIQAKRLAWCFALLAATAPCWAEKPTIISLATTSRWGLETTRKVNLTAISKWGGDPALDAEYGVKSATLKFYSLYPENKRVAVIEEEALDPSSAYGLLTLYSTEDMVALPNVPLAAIGKGTALMARGKSFLRVTEVEGARESPTPKDQFSVATGQLHSLLKTLGESFAPEDLRSLPGALPSKGLIQGTEKYMLGPKAAQRAMPAFQADLIGFSQGAEARLARYRSGGSQVKVLIITYPTPQIAKERYGAMEKSLGLNAQKPGAFGKRSGSFVVVAMDAPSEKSAQDVLGRFVTSRSVAWDQRYPGDESIVMQAVRLVLANIILTFFLSGFALGGGVLFFFSKVAARKWFPRTAWGQPDEATIIKLNLE